ncbi:MAG: DUF2304 domain-containing protein [Coriobacteriales bacterium]|jgi:hypothetical protein|nr:DUF2304 domain-containing protein [Coriobacteriales bacterium]
MTITLRVILIAGALLTLVYFLYQIRRRRLQIDYSLYWILLSVLMLVIALFPQIIIWTADRLGFISPANMVFLLIIFLLVIRLFALTGELSKLNRQTAELTQRLALLENNSALRDDAV